MKYLINIIINMKIFKTISFVIIASMTLASCSSTKTATTYNTNSTKEIAIITTTDNIIAKQGEMSEADIKSWPHMDVFTDSVPGMSLAKAYDFVKNKEGKTVVVGVIDSGIDIEHEDLKDVIWVNKNEIAGNGKDDDNNGYADDINGWNFLGGEIGQANPEQLEMTRIVKKWMPRFEGKTVDSISDADKSDFELFEKLTKIINDKNTNAQNQVTKANNMISQYSDIKQMLIKANDTIRKLLVDKPVTLENVNSLNFDDQQLLYGKMVIMKVLDAGEQISVVYEELDAIIDNAKEIETHYSNQLNSQYKIDFNGRVAGDNPYDITDTNYGNGYVIGSKDDEIHGTHVSGIIAAKRNNGIGMNGVANNVKIMAIRAVPDGDEYDKDVALAIRYAVDNGAKVVNMSFGKGYSPNAEWVYDAIKYAADKDVLLVHAAGNDSSNSDTEDSYPNDSKDKLNEFADNVITVGAMTRHFDENLVASFSNYGKNNVDIFAPGLEIYSTYPKNSYESIQGTSMASPEVAGVAALIRSYYPNLSASQVKKIIMNSGIEFNGEVIKPGSSEDKINFTELSVSGKILNAYNALIMAEKISLKL